MNKTIENILVPVDYSAYATEALHYAVTIADRFSSSLLVLHVIAKEFDTLHRRSAPSIPFPPMHAAISKATPPVTVDLRQQAEIALDQYVSDQCGGRAVERRVDVGQPVDQILALTRDEHVDLIVMGTHGRTGLARIVMGSVAEQVVRQAPCPVLMVKALPSTA